MVRILELHDQFWFKMGHKVVVKKTRGAAASILIEQNTLYGANDPRRQGMALGNNF